MFERALLTKGRTKTPLGVVLGITGELTAIGLAVLIPLVYTDRLPAFMTIATPLAPPSRAPEPPPQEVVKVAKASGMKVVKVVPAGALVAPTYIPKKVAMLIEQPESVGDGAWVPGSTGPSTAPGPGLPLTIGPAAAPPPPPAERPAAKPAAEKPPDRIRLGGNVQDAKVLTRIIPLYPPLARQARVQGTVTLVAVIGTDGHVKSLRATGGHPLLVPAALDAVRRWVYRPTMLNGEPVEVESPIEVRFTLGQ